MKRFVIAIALACALSGSALAGDAHSTGVQSTQPVTGEIHTAGVQSTQPLAGDAHTAGLQAPQESSDLLATVILTILSLIV